MGGRMPKLFPHCTGEPKYWQSISSIYNPASWYGGPVSAWSFLTNHARALLTIADQPDARLRDLAESLGVTERTAFGIVADLVEGGYVVKEREGRRNRYHIQEHLPLPTDVGLERTIGEVLDLLVAAENRPATAERRRRSTDQSS